MSTNDTTPLIHPGIDVAKNSLQVDTILSGGPAAVPNTPSAIRSLIKRIGAWQGKSSSILHVVCEASGGYERQLVEALHAAGIVVCVIQAKRGRDFANAGGVHAKTDAIDAAGLSLFGAKMEPRPTLPLTPGQRELSALVTRRNQIVETMIAEKNRAPGIVLAELRKMAAATLRHLEGQIARIDRMIAALIGRDADLGHKVHKLCQLQGVGTITAAAVMASLPELGTLNCRQMASLAGLAPRVRDSGKYSGKRSIGGGRAPARRALYMAALTAARMNAKLSQLYQRLVAKGKPKKVALTAVMRQMLTVMNSLLKTPEFVLE